MNQTIPLSKRKERKYLKKKLAKDLLKKMKRPSQSSIKKDNKNTNTEKKKASKHLSLILCDLLNL